MPKNKKSTEEKYQEVIDALKKDYTDPFKFYRDIVSDSRRYWRSTSSTPWPEILNKKFKKQYNKRRINA